VALCPDLSVGLPLFDQAAMESKRDAFELLEIVEIFDRSIKDRYCRPYNFVRIIYLMTIRLLKSPSLMFDVTRSHSMCLTDTAAIRSSGRLK
jgi:hypothetical protein